MLKEKSIISVGELFNKKGKGWFSNLKQITIPPYQRPYTWSEHSVNTLFTDILSACEDNKEEYRLGTIVLYDDGETLNIVDGQQRFTTLWLLLKNLDYQGYLPETEYSYLSIVSIKKNNMILRNNIKALKDKDKYLNYIINNCTFVKFVIADEPGEAFQFFDSQNARGKDLKPHDLLKAYHLREMNKLSLDDKKYIINSWENNYQEENLEKLFSENLYPLIMWYRDKSGLYFDKSKIKEFKGIKEADKYNYAIYHKYVQSFIEEKNEKKLFQLTQEILAGKKFFEYVFYYDKLSKEIEEIIKSFNNKGELKTLNSGTGNLYVYNLFKNILIFFADKFGLDTITEPVYKKLFCWCYRLRVGMHSVYMTSINKYAMGRHDYNSELNIFDFINNMRYPNEINTLCVYEIAQQSKNNEITTLREQIAKESNWQVD